MVTGFTPHTDTSHIDSLKAGIEESALTQFDLRPSEYALAGSLFGNILKEDVAKNSFAALLVQLATGPFADPADLG